MYIAFFSAIAFIGGRILTAMLKRMARAKEKARVPVRAPRGYQRRLHNGR